jgi:hypothetical protein
LVNVSILVNYCSVISTVTGLAYFLVYIRNICSAVTAFTAVSAVSAFKLDVTFIIILAVFASVVASFSVSAFSAVTTVAAVSTLVNVSILGHNCNVISTASGLCYCLIYIRNIYSAVTTDSAISAISAYKQDVTFAIVAANFTLATVATFSAFSAVSALVNVSTLGHNCCIAVFVRSCLFDSLTYGCNIYSAISAICAISAISANTFSIAATATVLFSTCKGRIKV